MAWSSWGIFLEVATFLLNTAGRYSNLSDSLGRGRTDFASRSHPGNATASPRGGSRKPHPLRHDERAH